MDQRGMVGLAGQGCSRLHGRKHQCPLQYQPDLRECLLLGSSLSLLGKLGDAKMYDKSYGPPLGVLMTESVLVLSYAVFSPSPVSDFTVFQRILHL